jgi:arylsulfatase A-like enzyme
MTTGRIMRLAATLGLLAGLAEVGLRIVQRFVLHTKTFLSLDVVWMAPVADLTMFLVLGVALALARRLAANRIGFTAVTASLLFLLVAGPALAVTRLHPAASMVLAAGLAIQTARILKSRSDTFERWVRRAAPWLVGAVVAISVVTVGLRWWNERQTLAELPEPDDGAPNLLLLVLDTVRSASMSLYGHEQPTTPSLDRFARRGVTFNRAVATAPWTLPTHATLLTGRYPHDVSADWQSPLDGGPATLAEILKTRGYVTAGFAGNLLYATDEDGLSRGFIHYEDYPVSVPMIIKSSLLARRIADRIQRWLGVDRELVSRDADDIRESFLNWLASAEPRPFFAFLNFMDAHAPYLPPEPFDGRFGPRRTGRAFADLSGRRDWSDQEILVERAAYEGEIAYLDSEIGKLLSELEERGVLDNTIVVVTSDHGELFGEHGLMDHGNSLYAPLLAVPLIIVYPSRVPGDMRIAAPASLRDLPATMLDLAEIDGGLLPGRSLAALWSESGQDAELSAALSEVSAGVRMSEWTPVMRGDMKSLVLGSLHNIWKGCGGASAKSAARPPPMLGLEAKSPANSVLDRRLRAPFR